MKYCFGFPNNTFDEKIIQIAINPITISIPGYDINIS